MQITGEGVVDTKEYYSFFWTLIEAKGHRFYRLLRSLFPRSFTLDWLGLAVLCLFSFSIAERCG